MGAESFWRKVSVRLPRRGGRARRKTGFHFSSEEYRAIGERIWNLARLFNVREGFSRADDTLPDRLFDEPLDADGCMRIDRDAFERSLLDYYALRGWDENGVPTPQSLRRLGLGP
jgi:aldehyde:ferredoxin oxidoreductase